MATVVNSIRIAGAPEPVFDLVTSARFWPRWHPASRAVGGVIERPYQQGDVIYEHVEVAGQDLQVSWKVTEHVRPTRILLKAETASARIIYSFAARGAAVDFTRELEYDEALLRRTMPDLDELRRTMDTQSDEGLRRLKALVEGILRDEAAGL
jgi:hypothetical protein